MTQSKNYLKMSDMALVDLSTSSSIVIRVSALTIQGDAGVALKELCQKKIQESPRDIHFDFRTVKYMDSVAIGVLLFLIQLAKKHQKKIYLDAASSELEQLLKSLILDQYMVM